jgi:predicted  nucleic acid-binding Zn-ribbon protein
VKSEKVLKAILALSVFICACCAGLWPSCPVFADPTPVADTAFDTAAKELEQAKDETQKLKDAWDKSRLETTLYDQRAKRAYQKWVKAAKKVKDAAGAQKERAELEFQLAVEKRKLAYNEWQVSQLRVASHEAMVKALDQQKESGSMREKIKQMEGKLDAAPRPTVGSSP